MVHSWYGVLTLPNDSKLLELLHLSKIAHNIAQFVSAQHSPILFHTQTKSGKAKKVAQPPCGRGVVYIPGDINGLTKKLHLLVAEFFAGNATVRNELVHVLDALLRLKQLTLILPLVLQHHYDCIQ